MADEFETTKHNFPIILQVNQFFNSILGQTSVAGGDVDGEDDFVGARRKAHTVAAGLIADIDFEILLALGFAGDFQGQIEGGRVLVDASFFPYRGIHLRLRFGRLDFTGERQCLAVADSDLCGDDWRVRRLGKGVNVPARVDVGGEGDRDLLTGLQGMGSGR